MASLGTSLLFASTTLLVLCGAVLMPERQPAHDVDDDRSCDPGKPLLLTPYIRRNEIHQARNLSRIVLPNYADGPHGFSGFLTVNESDSSQMFFWFVTSDSDWQQKPLLVWLTGGPGGSSLTALFNENGPYRVDVNLNVHAANYSWTQFANVVYIDNPVGTGFSFTKTLAGFARDELQVGWNLYRFVEQFYLLFPELARNELYLTGESYAGKYLPALAYRIHEQNGVDDGAAASHVPLAGVAMGDPFTDPQNQITPLASIMYNLGLADNVERDVIFNWTARTRKLIEDDRLDEAFKQFLPLLFGSLDGERSYFYNITGSPDPYNILQSRLPIYLNYYSEYVTKCLTRRAIHVGRQPYGRQGLEVILQLEHDFMDTVRQWLPPLFDAYRFLIYNGQLDLAVAPPLTEHMLQKLKWSFKSEFDATKKRIWRVKESDVEVAGFVRELDDHGFYQVIVRGAGHMVPIDQPRRAFDMMKRFVEKTPFN